jgi:hypothetical protein
VGAVTEQERACWEHVMHAGEALADAVAEEHGPALRELPRDARGLARRRLLRRDADRFLPLGTAA